MIVEQRLAKIIGELPTPPAPIAMFVSVTQDGNTLYLSGQGPIVDGKAKYTGKLGAECDTRMGYDAARLCGVNLLAHLKAYLGDLDRVEKILKATIYVASTPDYFDQPLVANGLSELMVEAFGEKGRHARCALGLAVLPGNIPVEVEMTVRVH